MIGGIEAGGTKFVCAVGNENGEVLDEVRFPTTTPEESLGRAVQFFKEQESKRGTLAGIGIASFGPVDLNRDSPTYGYVTTTPKPGWANAEFRGVIAHEFDVPVGFDTDVNGAALGEWKWGGAQGLDTFAYLTIGTGIGGGVMSNSRLMHGLIHPEFGHVRIPHDNTVDPYGGCCPYHGDCFEGLASGPALGERWGDNASSLPEDHQAWELEANYIASALHSLICTISPQRILLGGGVMDQKHLFPKIRKQVLHLLNDYVQTPVILQDIDTFIVPPALGNKAGVMGALALALSEMDA